MPSFIKIYLVRHLVVGEVDKQTHEQGGDSVSLL
jgi:hypothetical protein